VDLPAGYNQQKGKHGELVISKAPEPTQLIDVFGKRETFQNQVFRPGYNMATMSIEEAGEIDYQVSF
jgi:hypothetical protein